MSDRGHVKGAAQATRGIHPVTEKPAPTAQQGVGTGEFVDAVFG
jgi:hypothetical protein